MSTYVFRSDIAAEFDLEHLLAALDDNKDTIEDAGLFDALATAVDAQVQAQVDLVAARGLPVLPATYARQMAKTFMGALLFRRRGVEDGSNPFAKSEAALREQVASIVSGDLPTVPRTLSILTTESSSYQFITELDETATSTSAATSTVPILEAPDGSQWQMKIKMSGGQVVHYWEEVA